MTYDNPTLREKRLKTFVVTIREINMHGGPENFLKSALWVDYIIVRQQLKP